MILRIGNRNIFLCHHDQLSSMIPLYRQSASVLIVCKYVYSLSNTLLIFYQSI